ncbi:hypothetical protein NMG60_11028890 [Bertholletia excelsa]
MESKGDPKRNPTSTPTLPLLALPPMPSPDRSGTLTPPLHTAASVPFRWESEPGKPRPCTALIAALPDPNSTALKCLELPPRLQALVDSKMTKTPSPTAVLDGPYVGSFRCIGTGSSPERRQPERKERRVFGGWGRKGTKKRGKEEVGGVVGGGGSFVFPSLMEIVEFTGSESGTKSGRLSRDGSFSSFSQAKTHFWAAIYESFKHVLPWRSKKQKKEGLVI